MPGNLHRAKNASGLKPEAFLSYIFITARQMAYFCRYSS